MLSRVTTGVRTAAGGGATLRKLCGLGGGVENAKCAAPRGCAREHKGISRAATTSVLASNLGMRPFYQKAANKRMFAPDYGQELSGCRKQKTRKILEATGFPPRVAGANLHSRIA